MKKVRIVAATAKNQIEFRQLTLLGQSLNLIPRQRALEISIYPNNTGDRRRGLGAFYNAFFQPKHEEEILLFIHDDVYLHDWHIVHRLNDAIEQYDVIGLAGNVNPDLEEPSWALAWDRNKYPRGLQPGEYLSGAVGHLVEGRTYVSNFGNSPQECQLLDGLFLAVNTKKVLDASVRFDPQFEFHFYDLDFCRQCHNSGLKLGTWPIAVTHASRGAFNSPDWRTAKDKYLLKWNQPSIVDDKD
jgi:GT2 family glycosyltransferase